MGKSPGKWIKSVLFGKRSSKSSYPKNAASEKRTSFVSNVTTTESTLEYPVISDLTHQASNQRNGSTELENGSRTNLAREASDILPGDQGTIIEAAGTLGSAEQTDIVKLEQAAARVQAVFRGYLARRAFRALKGIIRLQALIRGHLVRRQAVSTLRCMQAIVKFQVLIRDRQVEILDSLPEEPKGLDLSGIDTVYISEKLSKSGYFIKLISSGSSVPLVLQYEEAEPNSVWSWLQRWSVCRIWEPPKGLKKGVESKQQKKQQRGIPTTERESWKSKRTIQKASLSNGDSTLSHSTTDHEKSKRHQKKAVASQSESTQEHPQSELERVKRNLRKVSMSAEEAFESANEKPQRNNPRKISISTAPPPDASQNGTENTSEKKNGPTTPVPERTLVEASPTEPLEAVEAVEKLPSEAVESSGKRIIDEVEVPSKLLDAVELPTEEPLSMVEEPHEFIDDHQQLSVEHEPRLENDSNGVEGGPILKEESQSKEDNQNKENQKARRRRSLPGKQEATPSSLENVSQNIPTTLPSYMAATESAKAKLRAQGLAKAANQPDVATAAAAENNGFVRRHSLPSSSTNGKISSLSPRVQRPTNLSNGKSSSRPTDRSSSLMSSRDDKQVQQPGWRR